MKHKKTAKASSRMGVKAGAKRRHARKPAARNRTAEAVTEKLNILTPL